MYLGHSDQRSLYLQRILIGRVSEAFILQASFISENQTPGLRASSCWCGQWEKRKWRWLEQEALNKMFQSLINHMFFISHSYVGFIFFAVQGECPNLYTLIICAHLFHNTKFTFRVAHCRDWFCLQHSPSHFNFLVCVHQNRWYFRS